MGKVTATISFYNDLLDSDLKMLRDKNLYTEENVCLAFIKNIRIN